MHIRVLPLSAVGRPLGSIRVDYTKGIPERLWSGAATGPVPGLAREVPFHSDRRAQPDAHQALSGPGCGSRGGSRAHQPPLSHWHLEVYRLPESHHSHAEIQPYYREEDVCLVTALHNGMNLVAKEFIVARHDEQGARILSRFTGASHELADALVVNPYGTDELAHAIHTALTMSAKEKRARMKRMRAVVQENNAYRWAGNLIRELAAVRLETAVAHSNAQPGARSLRLPLVRAGRGAA